MFKKILIFLGEGGSSHTAIATGVSLARVLDAEVLFFSVLPGYVLPVGDLSMMDASSSVDFHRAAKREAASAFAVATAIAEKAGVFSRNSMGTGKDEADCVIEIAQKRRCDLIVVGSEGQNAVMRLLSGSVIPRLISRAMIPVMVVRDGANESGNRWPTKGTSKSTRTITTAQSLQ